MPAHHEGVPGSCHQVVAQFDDFPALVVIEPVFLQPVQQSNDDPEAAGLHPIEHDLGPVRYLATLLGSTDEATMRLFIRVVALLLLAATRQGAVS